MVRSIREIKTQIYKENIECFFGLEHFSLEYLQPFVWLINYFYLLIDYFPCFFLCSIQILNVSEKMRKENKIPLPRAHI